MILVRSLRQSALLAPILANLSGGASAQTRAAVPVQLSSMQIQGRVARCGVLIARVTIRDDRDLQEDVIAIAPGPSLTDAQFTCVARVSLEAATYVTFDESDQQRRYNTIYRPIEDGRGVSLARAWLNQRGLLDKLPRYDPPSQTLAAYGRELETFCGIPRGTVLTSVGGGLSIRNDLLLPVTRKAFRGEMTDGQFECLLNASTASNLHEHRARFGFIGNAAAVPAQ